MGPRPSFGFRYRARAYRDYRTVVVVGADRSPRVAAATRGGFSFGHLGASLAAAPVWFMGGPLVAGTNGDG
jgi:hypothetical protein